MPQQYREKVVFTTICFLIVVFLCPLTRAEAAEQVLRVPLTLDNPCSDQLGDGPFKQNYKSGVKFLEGQCQKGKKVGMWKKYYSDGTLWSEESFASGMLQGQSLVYSPSGEIVKEEEYDMGQPIMLQMEANSLPNTKDEFDGSVKRKLSSVLLVSESGSVKIQERPSSSDSHGQDQKMYRPYPANKNASSEE